MLTCSSGVGLISYYPKKMEIDWPYIEKALQQSSKTGSGQESARKQERGRPTTTVKGTDKKDRERRGMRMMIT